MEWLGRYREAFMTPRTYSCDKWEHYFDIYDELLGRYYGKPGTNYLEIGIQNGGSLEIMRNLLGPDATISGLDIDPRCAELGLEECGIANEIHIGSQADSALVAFLAKEVGPFDVVLDDGSHIQADMLATFLDLFPAVKQGGIYIIEDTHTNHYPAYQQSFLGIGLYDYFKGVAERLNIDFMDIADAEHRYRQPREARAPRFRYADISTEIHSVQFFDSMIAIRKKTRLEPLRLTR